MKDFIKGKAKYLRLAFVFTKPIEPIKRSFHRLKRKLKKGLKTNKRCVKASQKKNATVMSVSHKLNYYFYYCKPDMYN